MNLVTAQPPRKQAPEGQAKQKQQPPVNASPPPVPEAYKAYPNKYAEACYQAQDHDAADLCAQWRTAVAAERSADVAASANYIMGAGALLSFIGIVLVLIALGQTRKANRIASHTAQLQLRAYISLGVPDLDLRSDGEGEMTHADIVVLWRNVGQTPAKGIKDRLGYGFFGGGLPDDFDFPEPKHGEFCDALVLGPTQQFRSVATHMITRAEFENVAQGRQRAFAWASINYDDVYGDPRRSEVAFEILITPLGDGTHNIGFNAIPRHNAIDEDCLRPPKKREEPRHWTIFS